MYVFMLDDGTIFTVQFFKTSLIFLASVVIICICTCSS